MTDSGGCPQSVLPASQVVRFLVPTYLRDDPSDLAARGRTTCHHTGKARRRRCRGGVRRCPVMAVVLKCARTGLLPDTSDRESRPRP
ncbi:hypothetical protein ATP06_0216020 [Amycolatopsis regifaucium]|uniref:Uncharacterized protein n=1 Tax=Amycolatopsis regifaucium TaxID=546365 RepID=A0ABX3DTK7_9PSEU|nr:hypothetical protein ATP06_0216020 [Amycolatopsis regifaucium]